MSKNHLVHSIRFCERTILLWFRITIPMNVTKSLVLYISNTFASSTIYMELSWFLLLPLSKSLSYTSWGVQHEQIWSQFSISRTFVQSYSFATYVRNVCYDFILSAGDFGIRIAKNFSIYAGCSCINIIVCVVGAFILHPLHSICLLCPLWSLCFDLHAKHIPKNTRLLYRKLFEFVYEKTMECEPKIPFIFHISNLKNVMWFSTNDIDTE